MMLFFRLILLFQYDAINFGSGLSKMKFRDFVLGSFIGMAPGGFINAMLGSSLENIISVLYGAWLLYLVNIYTNDLQSDQEKKKRRSGNGIGITAKCFIVNAYEQEF